MTIIAPTLLFQQAKKFQRLTTAKKNSFIIAGHYYNSGFEKYQGYAAKILDCSNQMNIRVFSEFEIAGLVSHSSIENVRWCRCRHCPMCVFARASKHRARLFKAFKGIDFAGRSFAFLTLTQKNCPISELRDTLKLMNEGWNRLQQRRTFPAVGFLRTMEVTIERQRMPGDKKKNTGPLVRSSSGELMAHPHFHILLEMQKDYFINNLKLTPWWVGEWASALRIDYLPIVDIRKVKSNDSDFTKAILETAKYCLKPEDITRFVESQEWLIGCTEQLHGLRSMRVGGSFAKLLSQKVLDAIDSDESVGDEESQLGDLIYLNWDYLLSRWSVSDYLMEE